ncbi:MAG: FGGY-family carbohydrate kinase [Candidatus Hodarchaeota archaeon]
MTNREKYILAIDQATSGAKTALVSTHGKIIDWVLEEYPLYALEGGGAEQDPAEWWTAITSTIKKLVDKNLVPVEDIVAISNTSQWSCTMAVDEDGNHLMNAISWMDTRGAKQIKELHKSIFQVSGYSIPLILKSINITGGGPTLSGKDPIAHILWLKEEKPEIYEKSYKLLEPQDWVNFKLTGEVRSSYYTMHLHWIMDIRKINEIHYADSLIKRYKIDKNKLPDLGNSTDILGTIKNEIADELGLTKEVKVVLGAPDNGAACIGGGAIEDYNAILSMGTSDYIQCHVPYKKTDVGANMASISSPIPGKYLLTNEQDNAGGALAYLKNNIIYHEDELLKKEEQPDVYKIFDKIVEKVNPGSNNLIFTPWLTGERAPVDDHALRGGLFNLSLDTTREHIIRSVYEGVALNIRWLSIYVEKFIKRQLTTINAIGGAASSDIWCQIVADVLDRPINQVENPRQANALGAAFIASVALGYMKWEEIPRHITISKTYKPNRNDKPIYDKLFKEYKNIYKMMRKISKRLNVTH